MKVCILTETYYPVVGGGETQAQLLAQGLVANGVSVIILTRRCDSSHAKTERFGEVTIHRLPPVGSGQLKKWGLLVTSFPALVSLHREYDMVLVSGFRRVGIAAVLASKLFGKICILKADSLGEMSGDYFRVGLARLGMHPSSSVFRLFLGLQENILKRANAFVAICADVDTELRTRGVKPASIQMISNSVDTSRFRPVTSHERNELRERLDIFPKGKIAIFTGRLVSYKGLPLLLRVWRDITRKHNHARLLLVGSGGLDIHNCEAELKEYVSANGLQRNVHFTGSVNNVQDYLQASDIFVFPTENDAFPSSLIEAMACGLPAIATPVGGIVTIITNGQNGLMVNPGNHQQLFDALDALITDSSLSARLGRAARASVEDRYSVENVTQQYVDLFRRISNQASSQRY